MPYHGGHDLIVTVFISLNVSKITRRAKRFQIENLKRGLTDTNQAPAIAGFANGEFHVRRIAARVLDGGHARAFGLAEVLNQQAIPNLHLRKRIGCTGTESVRYRGFFQNRLRGHET